MRALVRATADPAGSREAALIAACRQVRTAVEALTATGGRAAVVGPETATRTEAGPALTHLRNLEKALSELAMPLGAAPGSRPAGP